MYTQVDHERFLYARAWGTPFDQISANLGIHKTTLIAWAKKFKPEIEERRRTLAVEARAKQKEFQEDTYRCLTSLHQKIKNNLNPADLLSLPLATQVNLFCKINREITSSLAATVRMTSSLSGVTDLLPSETESQTDPEENSSDLVGFGSEMVAKPEVAATEPILINQEAELFSPEIREEKPPIDPEARLDEIVLKQCQDELARHEQNEAINRRVLGLDSQKYLKMSIAAFKEIDEELRFRSQLTPPKPKSG